MDASSTFAPDGSVRSFERLGSFVAGNSWSDGAIHLIRSQQFDPVKSSEHVHDEVVHLGEHHEVNRQTGASVLGGRVACQPGEGVVLL